MNDILSMLKKCCEIVDECKDCNMRNELHNRLMLAYNYALDMMLVMETFPK